MPTNASGANSRWPASSRSSMPSTSRHGSTQVGEAAEACEQVAFADLMLLNKTDLSTPEKLDETERHLAQLNKIANIHRTKNSEMDLSAIFDLGSADFSLKLESYDGQH